MATLRKPRRTRQLQQKKKDKYLQVMPVLVSPLSAGLSSQLSFILDGQSTRGSKIPPEQQSVLFCDVTKASGISELIFIERGAKMTSGNELDGYDLPDHSTFTSLLRGCKQHCPGSLDSNLIMLDR